MQKFLSLFKNPIVLVAVLVIAGIGAFVGFRYLQDRQEVQYLRSLEIKRADGAMYVDQLLKARQELADTNADNDFAALTSMGVNLNILGEKERALEWYEQALAKDPQNILVLNNMADIYSDLRQYDRAEGKWLNIIRLYPDKTMFYRSLGYLYWYRMQKSPQDIEALFKGGLEATENDPDLLNWLLSYFLETGNNGKFVEYTNILNAQRK